MDNLYAEHTQGMKHKRTSRHIFIPPTPCISDSDLQCCEKVFAPSLFFFIIFFYSVCFSHLNVSDYQTNLNIR